MKTKLTFLITALLFVCIVKAQNVITVDNSVGANAQYDNLQTAIAVAAAGDIIYVHPSENTYGNVSINKSITLIGYGHLTGDKRTTVEDIILGDGASDTKISGFYINDDLYVSNTTVISNITIENNYVKDDLLLNNSGADNVIIRGNIIYQLGTNSNSSSYNNYTNTIISNNVFLYVLALKNYLSITVKNNIFLRRNYSGDPIYNTNSGSGSINVQNNIIVFDSSYTMDANSDGVIFENCMAYNAGSGNTVQLTGTNNLYNQDPFFVATNNLGYAFYALLDDYNLQIGSPGKGTGAGGVDMGIYDGTFNFSNSGYTNGVPTVNIDSITDRVAPGANLSVTISTNAN